MAPVEDLNLMLEALHAIQNTTEQNYNYVKDNLGEDHRFSLTLKQINQGALNALNVVKVELYLEILTS